MWSRSGPRAVRAQEKKEGARSGPVIGLERSRPAAGENRKEKGREGKGCWAASGPAQEGEEKEKAGPEPGVGPKWKKMNFSKSNHFPNLFPLFSILSQIQIEFEFNFESTSPTFNQKQYALA